MNKLWKTILLEPFSGPFSIKNTPYFTISFALSSNSHLQPFCVPLLSGYSAILHNIKIFH